MPQSYTSLYYHLIFSTKGRVPVIADEFQQRLYDYIGGIISHDGGNLLAAGGTNNHIHLLTTISKQLALADALHTIKANSSRWVHETFPHHNKFLWQAGYGAFTVSASNIDKVKNYIVNQEEHHRKKTFEEEF